MCVSVYVQPHICCACSVCERERCGVCTVYEHISNVLCLCGDVKERDAGDNGLDLCRDPGLPAPSLKYTTDVTPAVSQPDKNTYQGTRP